MKSQKQEIEKVHDANATQEIPTQYSLIEYLYRRPAVPLEKTQEILYDDEKGSPEYSALRTEELALLRQGISSLSQLQQEVLILRFADGMRCTEIATRISKSEGAVRTLLSRTDDVT